MKNTEKTMDQIVALCKGRGFVYPGSEIYGGLANSWDYGPLGVELKNNVKRAWWKKFVQENPYNVGLDAAILMNPEVLSLIHIYPPRPAAPAGAEPGCPGHVYRHSLSAHLHPHRHDRPAHH